MRTFEQKSKATQPATSSKSLLPSRAHLVPSRQVNPLVPPQWLRSPTLQAKLTISHPHDRYEQEADRVADQVMRMPGGTAVSDQPSALSEKVQRACAPCAAGGSPCPKCAEEESVQRKPLASTITSLLQRTGGASASGVGLEASSDEEARINTIRGGGQSLPESVRAFFEPRFGADFSQVRVHTDPNAAASAQGVNALAYTVGRDVVFGAGQYAPGTDHGNRLLAHELTHVVQQGDQAMVQRAVRFSPNTSLAIDHWSKGASAVAGDELQVIYGDFEANADIHVEADTAAELANWEVGFLQNDRVTWSRTYWTRPNADGLGRFLEQKLKVPTTPLRDHSNDAIVWAAPGEFVDVAAHAGGTSSTDISLNSSDAPTTPSTLHGSDVGGSGADGRNNIFQLREGDNFISFVSAHNTDTDEWRHLELIYWSAQVSVDCTPDAATGVRITKDDRSLGKSRRFRWTSAADQPAIGATLANDYVNDPANITVNRVDGWT
jgi:hypothetical protein